MGFIQSLRRIRTLTFYVLVYTLPLTLVPLLVGSFAGFLWVHDHNTGVARNTEALTREIVSDYEMSYFNVPGAPTIFDINTGPFYDAVKLRTADWKEKMDLTKTDADLDIGPGIDRMATVDGLLWPLNMTNSHMFGTFEAERDEATRRQGSQTSSNLLMSKWVYLTQWAWPDIDPWDAGFDQLLQYHAAHPPANNAETYYVECFSSEFLCGIWAVKHPMLVHFSVDADAPMQEDGRRSVTVKVINLPLENWVPRPGAFPSAFEQLLVVTSGILSLDEIEEYDSFGQSLDRLNDHIEDLGQRYRKTLGRLFRVEDWLEAKIVDSTLSDVTGMAKNIAFLASLLLGTFTAFIYNMIATLVSAFITSSETAEPEFSEYSHVTGEQLRKGAEKVVFPEGGLGDGPEMGFAPGENLMGDMFREFMEQHADMIGDALKDATDEEMDMFGSQMEDGRLRDTVREVFQDARDYGQRKKDIPRKPTGEPPVTALSAVPTE